MSRLILVRHGRTAHNFRGRLQGQSDIPLDEAGQAQAEALASAMESLDVAAVYSSPLIRARDTAEAIARVHGLCVSLDARFAERSFGQWEGLTRIDVQERWPDEFALWISGQAVPGVGVEPYPEVAQRFAEAAGECVARHDGNVVVVAHGSAISAGVSALLGVDLDGARVIAGLDNCACSVLEPLTSPAGTATMRLVSHNSIPDFARWVIS